MGERDRLDKLRIEAEEKKQFELKLEQERHRRREEERKTIEEKRSILEEEKRSLLVNKMKVETMANDKKREEDSTKIPKPRKMKNLLKPSKMLKIMMMKKIN